jgi:hypothetical protein
MSHTGFKSWWREQLSPQQPADSSLVPERQSGRGDEGLDLRRILRVIGFDSAADVNSQRFHNPDRLGGIAGVKSSPEQDWLRGANSCRQLPIGAMSSSP